MRVFLDFEASSLGKRGYPIEVGCVFEDGEGESHLIRPAPDWTDWDEAAEAIHHIARTTLLAEGEPVDAVAAQMLATLAGHELFASAPSWDGKWLSALLHAAGQPRHALRLRDTEEAWRETAREILLPSVAAVELEAAIGDVMTLAGVRERGGAPAHRALADAMAERDRWLAVRDAARALVSDRTAIDR
jgi:hypothetical protein